MESIKYKFRRQTTNKNDLYKRKIIDKNESLLKVE